MLVSAVTVALAAFWEVLADTAQVWSQPQYSHGWLIPLIALGILWTQRPTSASGGSLADALSLDPIAPNFGQVAIGVGAIAAAIGYGGDVDWLAGVGLSVVCVTALTAMLVDQPYAPAGVGPASGPRGLLYAVTAGGAALVIAGLAKGFGMALPGPHAGYYQVAGLATLALGAVGAAWADTPPSRSGPAEQTLACGLVALSLASWLFATQVDMAPLYRVSFISCLVGLFCMVGGLRLLRWSGLPLLFCYLMFPWPTVVEGRMLLALQGIAVAGAEAAFLLVGADAIREGKQLTVEGIEMEVIEACSGLAMGTLLIAMAVAITIVVRRPWWDKLVILLSCVPIAIAANIFRIVVTGFIWVFFDIVWPMAPAEAQSFRTELHHWAGITLAMPFALGCYWLEFKVLSMLTVEEEGLEAHGAGLVGQAAPASTR